MTDTEKLAAVKTALQIINKHHTLGDAIYDVRERAYCTPLEDGSEYEGPSWDHPMVQEYSDAVAALERLGML